MKNEKGEVTLFCVLLLVVLSGLLTLCALELEHSFRLMKKRTNLILCVKETKGELDRYFVTMGRLNWVLKNIRLAQAAAIFFPPIAPYVLYAEKLRRVTKGLQATALIPYFAKIIELKKRGCPLDPRLAINPFVLGKDFGFQRTSLGAAKLRSKKWTYYFYDKPYALSLTIDATRMESLWPKIIYRAEEKMGTLSSLLSSR